MEYGDCIWKNKPFVRCGLASGVLFSSGNTYLHTSRDGMWNMVMIFGKTSLPCGVGWPPAIFLFWKNTHTHRNLVMVCGITILTTINLEHGEVLKRLQDGPRAAREATQSSKRVPGRRKRSPRSTRRAVREPKVAPEEPSKGP